MLVTPPRRLLSLDNKLSIVKDAFPSSGEKVSLRQVARKHKVQTSQIKRWKKAIDLRWKFMSTCTVFKQNYSRVNSKHYTRLPGLVNQRSYSKKLIEHLKNFYDQKREKNEAVGIKTIRREIYRVDPKSLVGVTDNATRVRIWRLLKAWNISWRRATHKAQNTRHCKEVIADFRKYFFEKARMLGVKKCNIYNADQTNVPFSMESVYTYADCGSRTVSVKAVDSSNRCTVMLAGSLTGEKVIPYIVFKGKDTRGSTVKKEINLRKGYPGDVELMVQENAWFDEKVMLDWIDRVWKREVAVDPKENYYLLLDTFPTHMTSRVKREFHKCNTEIDYIPVGYISKLQMLDVVRCRGKPSVQKQFP